MTRRSLGVLLLLASACWKENLFFGPEPLDSSSGGASSSSSTSLGTSEATTSTTTDPPPASCGDGVLDPDEECDDGNDVSSDACLTTCKSARCGDGVQQLGKEQCDEGEGNGPGRPCEANCRPLLLKGNSAIPFPNGRSIAAADFDGDGTTDVAVSDDSDEVQIFLYDSAAKTLTPWQAQPVAGPSAELLAYDWTGDGKAEVAAALDEGMSSGVRVFEIGQMAPLTFLSGEPRSVALGHADGDGILDLIIAQPEGSSVQWALGTGAPGGLGATPVLGTPAPPVRVVAADVTDDGKADLVVSVTSPPGFLYFDAFQGEPLGPFTSNSLTTAADVVVARILPDTNDSVGVFDPQTVRLQRFGGDTSFVESKTLDIAAGLSRPRYVPLHAAFADLVMINAAAGSLHILPFPDGEVLAEKPSFQGFGTIADFADADFDGDGFQDLVVLSANGIWILLNQT